MMVTFVSQCEKNALKKTRRVLDSFADRIGDNTWQTIITQEGLVAVRKLLRQTASKSTAVSCHWIRSRNRSELVWVVGNRKKFNDRGIVPVHYTQKNVLKDYYENDWKYLPLIKALTALSALFHDWGKATQLFQDKLKPNNKKDHSGDPIRHEWISVLLLNAFILQEENATDTDWLDRLVKGEVNEKHLVSALQHENEKPLKTLPPAAKLMLWLIVSHHRLPSFSTDAKKINNEYSGEEALSIDDSLKYIKKSWGYENRYDEKEYLSRVKKCFLFPNGLLSNSPTWMKEVKKWSSRLHASLPLVDEAFQDGSYRVVLHHARLSLMLGDHFYSSQGADASWKDETNLFANTDSKTKQLKQKLDEHLVGVAKSALNIVHLLPAFEKEPPRAVDIRVLKKASPAAFAWQDKAVAKIKNQAKEKSGYGFFAVNMASTGCGKTFANAKIMQAVSDDAQSLRYILALGLRTLTLQTGDEYRQRIELDETELAVLIGSKAVMQLHKETSDEDKIPEEESGSESLESLLDENIDFECAIPEDGLTTLLKKENDRKFLYAPVLVCTIDHLMAATETKRGGKYILPALRLMSSDLVIDEIDDFTGSDLIAIGRLVHLASMLGRKVMISSATIPPDLAEGYFNIYQKGWQLYASSREAKREVLCAWIDEFRTEIGIINVVDAVAAVGEYREMHTSFVVERVKKLQEQPPKRRATIINCHAAMEEVAMEEDETKERRYFKTVQEAIIQKHRVHHYVDAQTDITVSFGVVRVANISPCVALTQFLLEAKYPEDVDVRVMAYHSQQVLLLRHVQEKHLDEVLKRKEANGDSPLALKNSMIRHHLDTTQTKNLIFILVATPVEEVGRDHDFDWAVIEPSSYRSIVQLSGRVRRHRDGAVDEPNIALMQYNWKAFREGDVKDREYFTRPGYEKKGLSLNTHDMTRLIDVQQIAERLDATPRIQKPKNLREKESLSDLEHCVTERDLTSYHRKGANTLSGYVDESWFLTAHPQYLHPFRKSEPTTKVFLAYDAEKDSYYFSEIDKYGEAVNREDILQIRRLPINETTKTRLWMIRDYELLLGQASVKRNKTKKELSLLFGELGFVHRDGTAYEYSDHFGLVRSVGK